MVDRKSLIQNYKFSTVLGASTIIFLVIAIFIGQYVIRDIIKNQAILKEKKETHKVYETKLNDLKKLVEKEKDLKDKLKKVSSAFPTEKDLPRLLVQFEAIATENGIMINSISEESLASETKSLTPGLKEIQYRISGEAQLYEPAKMALEKLYTALRVLSVTEVEMSVVDDSVTKSFYYGFDLRLKTYMRAD